MSRIAASTLLLFVVLSSLAAKDNPSPDLRAHGEHKKRGQSDLPDRERGTRVRIKYRQSRQPECFPHVQRISVDGVFQTPRGSTKPIAPLERCAKMVTAPSAAARAKSGNFSSTSREKRACGIVHGAGVLSGRSSQPSPESVNSRPLRLSGVPDTLENRQAGIFRKGGIRFREFTTIECRSAIRLNSLCVHAIEAQPYAPLFILGTCGFRHILQDNLPRNSHHAFRYTYRFHTNST